MSVLVEMLKQQQTAIGRKVSSVPGMVFGVRSLGRDNHHSGQQPSHSVSEPVVCVHVALQLYI